VELAETYRGRKVLVTGDTGFKGSWLATWLLHLGAEVIGYALPAKSASDNYVVCDLAARITHVDGDVCDHARFAEVVEHHRPEIVFHLAAQALVLESYANPRETFATNVMGTVNLLDAVRRAPSVKAVVVASSDKCYLGQPGHAAYRETDALGGFDPYSASKAAVEIAVTAMRHSFFQGSATAAIATARAGNVIGAGDWAHHRIVPDCIRALGRGESIAVRSPTAVRPWQHVLDALHGYLQLGARLLVDRERFVGGWNFGPTQTAHVSVIQLVEAVIAAWGTGTHTARVDASAPAEAVVLALDSSKAREQLGWSPVADLARAVTWTVDGYRAELAEPAVVFEHRVAQIRELERLARG